MIAGTDDALDAAADLDELAEDAVTAIARAWHWRRNVSDTGASSSLGALAKGLERIVDPTKIGRPSDLKAWLLTVDCAARDVDRALAFDAWNLVITVGCCGYRHTRAASERGWPPRRVRERLRVAYMALALEFAARGVMRSVSGEE
jgi:hypothetical protein